jgi:hypothetical protein
MWVFPFLPVLLFIILRALFICAPWVFGCVFVTPATTLTAGFYQMTFDGSFVHLNLIPKVLRWLQWMWTLKYTLKARRSR